MVKFSSRTLPIWRRMCEESEYKAKKAEEAGKIQEVGEILTFCENNEIICKNTYGSMLPLTKEVYLENKEEIGKVNKVLGPISDFMFSVQVDEDMKAESFRKGTKVFISSRFLSNMRESSEECFNWDELNLTERREERRRCRTNRGSRGRRFSRGGELRGRGDSYVRKASRGRDFK